MNIAPPWSPSPVSRPHQVCVRCVMDTSDPDITFDEDGVCSHCDNFETAIRPYWKPNEEGKRELEALIDEIRTAGQGAKYDCIIGLSGGVDSSFLATKIVEWGLRPLVVHVDAGWNSELAVKNIEVIINRLGLHLDTEVIDWNEMRDLQRAFLQSHVANQDTPQDHAFAGALLKKAMQHNLKYVVSGNNLATEGVLPQSWGYDAMDSTHIRDIHRRFGDRSLQNFPLLSFHDYFVTLARSVRIVAPLDLMPYSKQQAIDYLEREYGWRYYGGKHYESIWTRWFQAYYLPAKFGYDKRLAHLSSLIVAGSMTRDEALRELEKPLYTDNELAHDTAFIAKKLGYTVEELHALVSAPPVDYSAYATNEEKLRRMQKMNALVGRAVDVKGRITRAPARIARIAKHVLARREV